MSAPINGMSCANCLFFEHTDEQFGECRRHAPQPNSSFFVTKMQSVGSIKTDIHWPKVFLTSWCGQFAARKKSQQKHSEAPKKVLVRKLEEHPDDNEELKLTPLEPETASPAQQPQV